MKTQIEVTDINGHVTVYADQRPELFADLLDIFGSDPAYQDSVLAWYDAGCKEPLTIAGVYMRQFAYQDTWRRVTYPNPEQED